MDAIGECASNLEDQRFSGESSTSAFRHPRFIARARIKRAYSAQPVSDDESDRSNRGDGAERERRNSIFEARSHLFDGSAPRSEFGIGADRGTALTDLERQRALDFSEG